MLAIVTITLTLVYDGLVVTMTRVIGKKVTTNRSHVSIRLGQNSMSVDRLRLECTRVHFVQVS